MCIFLRTSTACLGSKAQLSVVCNPIFPPLLVYDNSNKFSRFILLLSVKLLLWEAKTNDLGFEKIFFNGKSVVHASHQAVHWQHPRHIHRVPYATRKQTVVIKETLLLMNWTTSSYVRHFKQTCGKVCHSIFKTRTIRLLYILRVKPISYHFLTHPATTGS